MAINKTKSTRFGIDTTHHVIQHLDINRNTSTLTYTITGYPSYTNYNSGNGFILADEKTFTFAQLPSPILTKINELKVAIEQQMIANLPQWSGGTQVNDDGTAI